MRRFFAAEQSYQNKERFTSYTYTQGIRSAITLTPDGTQLDPNYVAAVALLAKYGLSYELLLAPTNLQLACELATKTPNVTFIVDHLGDAVISNSSLMPAWMSAIQCLASLNNVYAKVG